MSITFSSPSRAMTFSSTSGTTFQAGGTQTYNWENVTNNIDWSALSGTWTWPDASDASGGPASSVQIMTLTFIDGVGPIAIPDKVTIGPYLTYSGTSFQWTTSTIDPYDPDPIDSVGPYLAIVDGVLSWVTTEITEYEEEDGIYPTYFGPYLTCDADGNISTTGIDSSFTYIVIIIDIGKETVINRII